MSRIYTDNQCVTSTRRLTLWVIGMNFISASKSVLSVTSVVLNSEFRLKCEKMPHFAGSIALLAASDSSSELVSQSVIIPRNWFQN